jgi:hypothetical protein
MLFLGLGTGVGSALIIDHVLVTLELGDLHFEQGSVSDIIGRRALEKEGKKAWRKAVFSLVPPLQKAFLADYGCSAAQRCTRQEAAAGVRLATTSRGGGYRLWGIDELSTISRPQAAAGGRAAWPLPAAARSSSMASARARRRRSALLESEKDDPSRFMRAG